MNNAVCRMVGCEFPLFAFSHCRDVVVAVSKAGGFGVLGATRFTPEQLEEELAWIDAHIDGAPYGVDVLVPEVVDPRVAEFHDNAERAAAISEQHRQFTARLLNEYGVDVSPEEVVRYEGRAGITPENGYAQMEVAFRHPIRLIANALGIAPPKMIEEGKKRGVPVAALVGAKEHALRQAAAGVDIIVAQGTEAGGHCGEVSTLVLIPEVVRALKGAGYDIPVLAAGGIMTGAQMAGMMAAGAQGAWTGSVWLATTEAETSEAFREKMIAARSRDTVRSRSRTGKPARQLKTAWHEAWDNPQGPGPLPMPLMGMVSEPAFQRIEKSVVNGNEAARDLVSYFVGQGVGLVDQVRSARGVVQDFREEFIEAVGELNGMLG
ncbi:nitronate monooxygenase [Novosphingobium sp.]|uniref:NAD(P)H-dependent flavin oxidoreductase n=1 Tax=Novosphingobium sp. TaxID=1874826 RepID=UPI0022CA6F12|nr:nitronate monooxygenase [Novosphingobium sp.]MCZ8019141.1 nitronate monooxygenase [Novosphingobium sp.]MCZ8034949.1 nitronate monooxygenase [Novosphingobium sp.]MCZ8052517.1 nitronate monooxygenase [Novosphingobium sp.]MCZ8058616.1 nitronate monooxygenase [Novosphingobium sp.]MCZ8233013.1 nitronate monooxygenase [Novosphingobium sp.]